MATSAEEKQIARASKVVDQLLRVEVTCKGTTPLLMNPETQEDLLARYLKTKKPKNAPVPEPRVLCEKKASVYRAQNGRYFIPVKALWACLINAGVSIRLDGKRQISNAKSTALFGLIWINDAILELDTPGWEVDIQPGKNPNGGEGVAVIRPRFDAWMFKVNITIDTAEIGEEKIRELFDIAGRRCGLLDYRPNRKGPYGQFTVERWERLGS